MPSLSDDMLKLIQRIAQSYCYTSEDTKLSEALIREVEIFAISLPVMESLELFERIIIDACLLFARGWHMADEETAKDIRKLLHKSYRG